MDARVKPAHDEFWMPRRGREGAVSDQDAVNDQDAVGQRSVAAKPQPVIAGLDPAIHRFGKGLLAKLDGCAGQARA